MLCQPKVGFEAELDVASIHEWEKGVKKQPAVVIIKKYFLAGVPWSSTTIRIVVLQDLTPAAIIVKYRLPLIATTHHMI